MKLPLHHGKLPKGSGVNLRDLMVPDGKGGWRWREPHERVVPKQQPPDPHTKWEPTPKVDEDR